MEEQERDREREREQVVAALNELKTGGRLQVKPATADAIAKAMHPLPPPWEWQSLREQVGLTAVDMADRTGFAAMRIRYWETGKGTMYAELWLDYAARLTAVVEEMLRENEQASLLRESRRIPLSPPVARHLQELRAVQLALATWVGQDHPCTPEEAAQFGASMRESMSSLRAVQRKLQRIAARKEQE